MCEWYISNSVRQLGYIRDGLPVVTNNDCCGCHRLKSWGKVCYKLTIFVNLHWVLLLELVKSLISPGCRGLGLIHSHLSQIPDNVIPYTPPFLLAKSHPNDCQWSIMLVSEGPLSSPLHHPQLQMGITKMLYLVQICGNSLYAWPVMTKSCRVVSIVCVYKA